MFLPNYIFVLILIIIDAVRNISKFSNAVNLEIEEPLKVFIAGAKSRIKI